MSLPSRPNESWFLSEVEFLSRLLQGQTNFYAARHTSGTSTLRYLSVMTAIPWMRNVITVPRVSMGYDRSLPNPATRPCTRINTKWRNRQRNAKQGIWQLRARAANNWSWNEHGQRENPSGTLLTCLIPTTHHLRRLSFSLPEPKKGREKEIQPL